MFLLVVFYFFIRSDRINLTFHRHFIAGKVLIICRNLIDVSARQQLDDTIGCRLYNLMVTGTEQDQFVDNIMVKEGHLKYQWYGEDRTEVLFDLKKNPEETQNWAEEGDYQTAMERFRYLRDIYLEKKWDEVYEKTHTGSGE